MIFRVLVLALFLAAPALRAQDRGAREVMTQAIRAYQDLDLDAAARLLRRVLTPPLALGLDDAERARALTYLGATAYYRERRDSAIAVFRELVVRAPGHRPDTLVFPPEIARLYDEVRSGLPSHMKLSTGIPLRIDRNAPDTVPHPQPLPTPVSASQSLPEVTATAAGLVLKVRTHGDAALALGVAGSLRFRRLELDVRYAEGQGRDLVDGAVALRFLATPWLSMQVGPHARRFATPFGPERWVTWQLGARGDVAIAGPGLRGHALLWRGMGLEVNVPPGSGSARGGEVGVTIDLAPRPFWFALAYGIDQAQVRDATRRETVETLTLAVGLRRR